MIDARQKAEEEAKNIIVPALRQYFKVMLTDVALGAIKDMVADSSNPYDDVFLASIEPLILLKIKELTE